MLNSCFIIKAIRHFTLYFPKWWSKQFVFNSYWSILIVRKEWKGGGGVSVKPADFQPESRLHRCVCLENSGVPLRCVSWWCVRSWGAPSELDCDYDFYRAEIVRLRAQVRELETRLGVCTRCDALLQATEETEQTCRKTLDRNGRDKTTLNEISWGWITWSCTWCRAKKWLTDMEK